jgi:hypothetical protein
VIEQLPSTWEALGSIPKTGKKKVNLFSIIYNNILPSLPILFSIQTSSLPSCDKFYLYLGSPVFDTYLHLYSHLSMCDTRVSLLNLTLLPLSDDSQDIEDEG